MNFSQYLVANLLLAEIKAFISPQRMRFSEIAARDGSHIPVARVDWVLNLFLLTTTPRVDEAKSVGYDFL